MLNIYINWKMLWIKTYIRYPLMIIISFLILYFSYNYTDFFDKVKYRIATYYTITLLESDAMNALEKRKFEIKNDFDKKIIDINKEYNNQIELTDSRFNEIMKDYKTKIEEDYKVSYLINNEEYDISELSRLSFHKDVYTLLETEDEINIDFSIIEKIKKGSIYNKQALKSLEITEDSVIPIIKKDSKENSLKVESVSFNYKVKELINEIKILDRSQLNNVLPY